LADDFRLDLEYGWLDTIRAGLSIREVAVLAVEDAVTLFPLVDQPQTNPATADEVAMLIEMLEDHFDLIVIDAPKGTSHHLQSIASKVDSAIIVHDADRTKSADVADFAQWLTKSGVQGVGIVENFVA
jgi:Mrp family chromosome partitioning ATPase